MKKKAVVLVLMLVLLPVAGLAVTQTITMVGNYIITGSLQVNSLAPGVGNCVKIGAGGLLISSGAACGGGGGGSNTQVFQVTAPGTTPWEVSHIFAPVFVTTPICTATSFSATPIAKVADIVSESTTVVTIFDSSHTGATYNVSCTGT